jgi:hypothetical protein
MKLKLGRVVLATALATLATGGVAQAACPTATVTQPFTAWKDAANYTLVPGGGFEAGMAAWTLNTNKVVAGNESYFVRSKTDTASLQVKANGVAVSPTFCVSGDYPTLRLFGRKLDPKITGQLKVEILYRTADGGTKVSLAGMLAHGSKEDYSSWRPSNILKLGTALPLSSLGGSATVQLRVTADKGGDWLIDDVYADPYSRG